MVEIGEIVVAVLGAERFDRRDLLSDPSCGFAGELVEVAFNVEAVLPRNEQVPDFVNVGDIDGVVVAGGQSRSRFIRSAVEAYFSKRVQAEVDPDLAVGLGAAIHADQLVNRRGDAVLIDVTPLSLRVGTVGGFTEVVIPKNTPIPIEHSKTFVTASDDQQVVRIRIYQGESKEHEQNELLGEFEFSGFRIARRGEIEVVVTFDIDANGSVNVNAVEKESGAAAQTTVRLSQNLSEAEIQNRRRAM